MKYLVTIILFSISISLFAQEEVFDSSDSTYKKYSSKVLNKPRWSKKKQYWSLGGGIGFFTNKFNPYFNLFAQNKLKPRLTISGHLSNGSINFNASSSLFSSLGINSQIDLLQNRSNFLNRPPTNLFLNIGISEYIMYNSLYLKTNLNCGIGIRSKIDKRWNIELQSKYNYFINKNSFWNIEVFVSRILGGGTYTPIFK